MYCIEYLGSSDRRGEQNTAHFLLVICVGKCNGDVGRGICTRRKIGGICARRKNGGVELGERVFVLGEGVGISTGGDLGRKVEFVLGRVM